MTFGQIIGPFVAGLAAAFIAVSSALISLTIAHFVLFAATLLVYYKYAQIKS